jgi:purine-binding chemotaxis protein CheW
MGRMADARKRARRRDGGGETPEDQKPVEETPVPVPDRQALPDEPVSVAAAELMFPADPEPSPSPAPGRLRLPASGLASEILGMQEVSGIGDEARDPEPGKEEPGSSPERDVSGHNLSFFSSVAREEKTDVAEATEHLATFYLDREEYGLPVRLVQEIIRVTEITQVPRAPDFIKGVINLRGRIIPVIDLRRKLKLGDVEVGRQTRIVVVKLEDRQIGLLVDGASQVLRVPVSSVEAAPEEVLEIDEQYIRGVAKLEKRLIILIDLSQVLARELRAVDGHGGRA